METLRQIKGDAMKTGIVKDRRYLDHNMGPFHVESPQRLEAIYNLLETDPTPVRAIEPRPASEEEIGWVHTEDYISTIRSTAGKQRVILDPDTSTSALSYETALLAAGGVLAAVDEIMAGRIDNGFALIRPPGHHAEAGRAMGFCLFNNIAIAAEYLLRKHGLGRVFIMDWDLHHGNGTQHTFYGRKDVLYASTHQFPFYPGTGHWRETGEGEGKGYTLNIPLKAGKGDGDYLALLGDIVRPVIQNYRPDFILVSAGFDIYAGDPLGGMEVSIGGFGAITDLLVQSAEICGGRLLHVLEGGYHIQAQAEAVLEVLRRLNGSAEDPGIKALPSPPLERELEMVVEVHRRHWNLKS
jgi:acetoin utilization deacetylase AcuC-like enzyme